MLFLPVLNFARIDFSSCFTVLIIIIYDYLVMENYSQVLLVDFLPDEFASYKAIFSTCFLFSNRLLRWLMAW